MGKFPWPLITKGAVSGKWFLQNHMRGPEFFLKEENKLCNIITEIIFPHFHQNFIKVSYCTT